MDRTGRQRRPSRIPADPPWYADPTLLFVALPAAAWLVCRLVWGG